MAYTTINKSTAHFNTKLYTGAGTSGSPFSLTGVGFAPDWTWIKRRDGADIGHRLFDRVRGATKYIDSSSNSAETTNTSTLTAFGSDGFTLQNEGSVNDGSALFTSWNWKANGAGSSDSSGSAYSATVSANTTAGFSIVKYTTGSVGAGMTVPHGLGVKPDVIIFKKLNATGNPTMYHKDAGGYLYINSAAAVTANTTWVTATSSLVTLANTWELYNSASSTYVMYCFAEKTGYSKFGKFLGNGNVDGTFVYTGFKPSFLLIKTTGAEDSWRLWDNARNTYNAMDTTLRPNTDDPDYVASANNIDFLSNGFKMRTTSGGYNGSSDTLIYMAFGQPIVGSNNVPNNAR